MNKIGDVTKAVIISGGKGERLGEQFAFTQKCLLPIVGRPILSYVIESLEIAGIKEIIIVTNHHSDDVEKFIKYSKPFNSKIIIEKIISDGTTGVLKRLKNKIDSNFIYCHGNIIYPPFWIKQLIDTYKKNTIALFGVSNIDLISTHIHILGKNGVVEKVIMPNGKPIPQGSLCAIELTIFNQQIFKLIENSPDSFRLGEALIQANEIFNYQFQYKLLDGMWVHIEIPNDLKKATSLIDSIWHK